MEKFYKRRKLILEDRLLKDIGRKKNWKLLHVSLGDIVGKIADFKKLTIFPKFPERLWTSLIHIYLCRKYFNT